MFSFRHVHRQIFSKVALPIYIPIRNVWEFQLSHSLSKAVTVSLFNFSHSGGLDVIGPCPRPVTNQWQSKDQAARLLMTLQGSFPHFISLEHPWEWGWHPSGLFSQSLCPNKMSVELCPRISSTWILFLSLFIFYHISTNLSLKSLLKPPSLYRGLSVILSSVELIPLNIYDSNICSFFTSIYWASIMCKVLL